MLNTNELRSNSKKVFTGRLLICLFSLLIVTRLSYAIPTHESAYRHHTTHMYQYPRPYDGHEHVDGEVRSHESEIDGNDKRSYFDPIAFKRTFFDPIAFKRNFDPILFKRTFDPILFKRTYFDPIAFKRSYFDPIAFKRNTDHSFEKREMFDPIMF
ncbi:unnamed protein product [Heterobilharzia americana]|nr:unnamed protein product [Heterobilharzia americana]CAH8443452.1 unnamed protein product [Heterobilharzia americana]